MRISESRLRRMIRQVIRENFEAGQMNEGWRENLTTGLAGLMMYFGSLGGVSAKPVSKSRASSLAEEIIEDEIGSLNIPLKNMVAEVLSSVDEEHIHIVEKEVLAPWLVAVNKAESNPKYNDPVTGFKPFVYRVLGKLLSDRVDEFIKSKRDSKRSESSVGNKSGYIQGMQSSLTKDQMKKYRADQERMQSALKDN